MVDLVHVDAAVCGEVKVVTEQDNVSEGHVGLEDLLEFTGLVLVHLIDLTAEALRRVRDLIVGDGVHHRFDGLLGQVQALCLETGLDDGDYGADGVEPGADIDVIPTLRHGPAVALLAVTDETVDFFRFAGGVRNTNDGVRRLDFHGSFLFE